MSLNLLNDLNETLTPIRKQALVANVLGRIRFKNIFHLVLLASVLLPLTHAQTIQNLHSYQKVEVVVLDSIPNNDSILWTQKVDSMLEMGRRYLGKPYRYRTNGVTMDCSGFVGFVSAPFFGQIPRTSSGIVQYAQKVEKSDLKPGDLVFFKGRNSRSSRVGHVGLIAEVLPDGTFKMIHSSTSRGVIIEKFPSPYFAKRLVGFGRFHGYNTETNNTHCNTSPTSDTASIR
jgi:hypothetical protein